MVTLTHYHTSPMNCSQFQLLTHEGDCNQQPPTLLSFCRLISPPSVIYLFLSPWLGCGTACQPRSHHQRCSTHLRSDWKLNKTPKICRLLIHANTVYFSAYLVTLFHCCTTRYLFLWTVLAVFGHYATIIVLVEKYNLWIFCPIVIWCIQWNWVHAVGLWPMTPEVWANTVWNWGWTVLTQCETEAGLCYVRELKRNQHVPQSCQSLIGNYT